MPDAATSVRPGLWCLLVGGLIALGCPKAPAKNPESIPRPSVVEENEAPPEPAPVTLVEGSLFPVFTGKLHEGSEFDLASLLNRGDYLLIDFWASWCAPCIRDLPMLAQLASDTRQQPFRIVSIAWDTPETQEDLNRAISSHGVEWPVITDWEEGENRWTREYGVTGIPASFLLAPDGTILMRNPPVAALAEIVSSLVTLEPGAYLPIQQTLTVLNLPAVGDPWPDTLRVSIDVHNPQVPSGELAVALAVEMRLGQETVELPDQIQSGWDGAARALFEVPVPAGAEAVVLRPWVESPLLGQKVPGQAVEISRTPAH